MSHHTLRAGVSATGTATGMVLLDEATGRSWQLNATATLVLRALLAGDDPEHTAHRLHERRPQLAPDQAADDVIACIDTLTHAHLVVTV
ncbi:lasso peptide biosynthesis PqqD family chaperone [Streptomyces aureocirculatus]|uniref:lasso peptide biosynthesis PqqD family chaperone n=1 Tax=Streptomyces aureocirculatus TaxID=67275 RepID=UPI00055C7B1F|nr:lasso peptide biosynthesis PqqD family chaperone [Streptomyces aureocirculatus]